MKASGQIRRVIAKKAALTPPPATSAGASMFDIIAEACGAVRHQAPRDLPPGSCQNFAIGLAWLLHQRGIPASITGGAAWWRVGPERADLIEYDPAVDPDSFPSCIRGFDSLRPLQKSIAYKN